MAQTKLTRRGKIVVALIVVAVVLWLFDITTPDECKVPVEQMSQFCADLIFP